MYGCDAVRVVIASLWLLGHLFLRLFLNVNGTVTINKRRVYTQCVIPENDISVADFEMLVRCHHLKTIIVPTY